MSNQQVQLPPGWEITTVGEVAEVALGKMLDKAKRVTGARLPYLRNVNVRWGYIDARDLLEMPFEDAELDRYGLLEGDVLVCEGGEPGRAAVWRGGETRIKYQKALHRIRPYGGIYSEWFIYALAYGAQSGMLESYFTGTTIKHFTRIALLRYRLPIPPLAEQRRIIAKIEALTERSRKAREALEAVHPLHSSAGSMFSLLDRLDQAILAKAFRGALLQQDPNDEPGSVLLERIRAERAASNSDGKKARGRRAVAKREPGLWNE